MSIGPGPSPPLSRRPQLVIRQHPFPGPLLGFVLGHASRDRGTEVVAAAGMPVHQPAQARPARGRPYGAALILDPVQQPDDLGSLDARRSAEPRAWGRCSVRISAPFGNAAQLLFAPPASGIPRQWLGACWQLPLLLAFSATGSPPLATSPSTALPACGPGFSDCWP